MQKENSLIFITNFSLAILWAHGAKVRILYAYKDKHEHDVFCSKTAASVQNPARMRKHPPAPLLSLHFTAGTRERTCMYICVYFGAARGMLQVGCSLSLFSCIFLERRIFPFCLVAQDFYFLISQLCGHSRNKEMAACRAKQRAQRENKCSRLHARWINRLPSTHT